MTEASSPSTSFGHATSSSEPGCWPLFGLAGQRDKSDSHLFLLHHSAVLILIYLNQALCAVLLPHRDDEAAAWLQLLYQLKSAPVLNKECTAPFWLEVTSLKLSCTLTCSLYVNM